MNISKERLEKMIDDLYWSKVETIEQWALRGRRSEIYNYVQEHEDMSKLDPECILDQYVHEFCVELDDEGNEID